MADIVSMSDNNGFYNNPENQAGPNRHPLDTNKDHYGQQDPSSSYEKTHGHESPLDTNKDHYGQQNPYGQPPAHYYDAPQQPQSAPYDAPQPQSAPYGAPQPPQAPYAPQNYNQGPPTPYGAPQQPYYGQPVSQHNLYGGAPVNYGPGTMNKFALVSFIASLAQLPLFFIGFPLAVVAVVFGHLALRKIPMTGETGRGLALTGVILGYVGVAFSVIVFIIGFIGGFTDAMNGTY